MAVELGPFIVVIIRLVVPLSIFRWPLAGGIASGLVDALDIIFISILGLGDFANYAQTDKLLDWYFLLFLAIISLRWAALEKGISLMLFAYRTVGVVLFELTGIRPLLLVFPNLFLYWWYAVALRDRFFPSYLFTVRRALLILGILLIPKLIQEYVLHYLQFQPWNWLRGRFF